MTRTSRWLARLLVLSLAAAFAGSTAPSASATGWSWDRAPGDANGATLHQTGWGWD